VVELIHHENEQYKEVVEEWSEDKCQCSMLETHLDRCDDPQVVLLVELHSIGSNDGCTGSYVQIDKDKP
jgi:hypothetical protein